MGVLPGLLRGFFRRAQYRRRPVHLAKALAVAGVLAACAAAFAADGTATPGTAVAQAIPAARMAGQGRLTWWGLAVYDATLWVAPGFAQAGFDRGDFALELAYLRPLRG